MRGLLTAVAVVTALLVAPPAAADLLGSGSDGVWRVSDDGASRDLVASRYVADATWSSDGERVAFSSFRDGAWRLLAGPPGGPFAEIDGSAALRFPAYSPDGTTIAAERQSGDVSDIVLLPAGGGEGRALTIGSDDHLPAWSPDGSSLAFIRRGALTVARSDGSEPRTLSSGASDPSWSPDGRTIAFSTARDANGESCENEGTEEAFCTPNSEIYAIGADGSGERRLTDSPADDRWPAWSPDGTRIAFASDRHWISPELYVMNGDGSCVTQLTLGAGFMIGPQWRPGRPPGAGAPCGERRARYELGFDLRARVLRGQRDLVPLFPGVPFRGMLPTEAGRGYVAYDECGAVTRSRCAGRIEATSYTTCRRNPARWREVPRRVERMRGALVLFYVGQVQVIAGGTNTTVLADAGTQPFLRRVVRALRPVAVPESAARRLARPQLPAAAWRTLVRSRRPHHRKIVAALRTLGAGRRPACA